MQNILESQSWKCHIDKITKEANSTMAFLRRNIRSSPRDAKAKAYKTLCVSFPRVSISWKGSNGERCGLSAMTIPARLVSLRWFLLLAVQNTLQQRRAMQDPPCFTRSSEPCGYYTRSTSLKRQNIKRQPSEQLSQSRVLPVQKNVYQNSFIPGYHHPSESPPPRDIM